MKKTIDVPDDPRQFMVLKGQELIAYIKDGYLYEKIVSCSLCGSCCLDSPNISHIGDDDEGKCNALVRYGDTWECGAGMEKPWRCLGDPNEGEYPDCSIRYKKTKVA